MKNIIPTAIGLQPMPKPYELLGYCYLLGQGKKYGFVSW
jgi:hypothetical protein